MMFAYLQSLMIRKKPLKLSPKNTKKTNDNIRLRI